MSRYREKHIFSDWFLLVAGLVLVGFAARSFWLWSNRDYGQLTTSFITASGVVLTLWMTQVRAIEQLRAEGQRDRAQSSITQRIDLAEKLVKSIDHLSSENERKQAAGVQEILFQIDDWHALIKSEIDRIEGKEPGESILVRESLRRRQELFDIVYKFDTKNVELLKSRARGLRQRLVRGDDHSLTGLDFSGMVIGFPGSVEEDNFPIDLIDLKGINAKGPIMHYSEMCYVDLSFAHLEKAELWFANLKEARLWSAHLEKADFNRAHLEKADLRDAYLEEARLGFAHLEEARLGSAHLEKANLRDANLEKANLSGAHLEEATLGFAHLEKANLSGAHLQGVDLRNVIFDHIALRDKKLLNDAEYNNETKFPDWLNPEEYGMRLVDETEDES